MEGLQKRFQRKHGIASRIFSLVLVFAMLLTMASGLLPNSQLTTKAAGTETNVTIHFMVPNNWDWSKPAIQYWGGSSTTVSGDTNNGGGTEIPNWNGALGYFLTKGTEGESTTDYSITLTGDFTGFQFLDYNETSISNTVSDVYDSRLTQYTGSDSTDVYYIYDDEESSWAWYTDAQGTTPLPDLPKTETTFTLVGTFPGMGWDPTITPNFTHEEGTNKYSITMQGVPASTDAYEYKILEDAQTEGWKGNWDTGGESASNRSLTMTAPANITLTVDKTDENKNVDVQITYIEDILVEAPTEAEKGQVTTLPATATYYDGNGNKTENVSVSYTAKTEGVTVSETSLTVPSGFTGTEVVLTAVANNFSKDITISVVEKLYTYTIYYYDFNAEHMSTAAADLWIWQKSGSGATAGTPFTGTEVLADDNTWLKAEIKVAYTDVAIIARSANSWGWQTSNLYYNNTDKADSKTIYITSTGIVSDTLPELIAPRERYVLVEYDRPAGDYDGWNIYTWNSGYGSDVTVSFTELGGKMVAKIPVKDSTADLMLSFCMRRSETGNDWAEKDGGDHYVNVPADQTVVKAKFVQGEGITEVLPYNTGYTMDGANGMIHFYYRDDTLAADNNLASLEGKVTVTVNGTSHPMTYNADEDRFIYDLEGISTGDYYYYYTADGTKVLDAFNSGTGTYNSEECSKCTYKKFDMTISAELSQASMDYNDNNVLSVKYHPADGENMDGFEVTSASVDLSALGLSSAQAINTELMELTIACKDTTTTGVKTLPVTVTDIYGNVYTTDASVTVTARDKSGDFDWDEAVIYFAVTDRFFDGNADNNDAYGVGDYNTSADTGGSSYHGGDFAGLTAKLDYLKELGVNTIWITPIVENITEDQHDSKTDLATYGYHGYWASSFTELNKHLGTKEEFQALLDAAHARGMKIMVDVVINHAGYGTETYFNSILTDEDGDYIAMLRDDGNTVSGDDKLDALSDLPDFVTENEAVRNQLVQWQTQWMDEFDIDYYRVDTVKHVDNTTWAAFKNSLTKVNPDFKMIGEYAGAGYANTAGELGTGSMDSLLDFDFNGWAQSFLTGDISGIEQNLLKRNSAINNTASMGQFLSSHDEDTLQSLLVSENNLSETEAYNLMKVAATLQITAKGQPVIYYGEEIGQGGANDWPYQTNRRDFDWTELEKQMADSNSIYSHYKTMLAIRSEYSEVFAKGDRASVLLSDAEGYDVISRSYGGDTLYVGMNIKDAARTVTIPVDAAAGAEMENLYDGTLYTVAADQTVTITIPAAADGGTIVLKEAEDDGYRLVIPVTGTDFSEVLDTISKVEDGADILVILNDTATVPAEVINAVAGRDIDMYFSVSDEATWYMNGKSVVSQLTAGVDMGVTLGGDKIPADKVKAVAGDNKTLQLSLAHDGKFGYDAGLILLVGTGYKDQYANLFYYNPATGKLEYSQADKVDADGYVRYQFSHASDYVIVFSSADMNPSIETNTTPTVTAPVQTGDTTPVGAAVAVMIVAAGAMTAAVRRKLTGR